MYGFVKNGDAPKNPVVYQHLRIPISTNWGIPTFEPSHFLLFCSLHERSCPLARCKHTRIARYCRFSWSSEALDSFLRSGPPWQVIPEDSCVDLQKPPPMINLSVITKICENHPKNQGLHISTTTIGDGGGSPNKTRRLAGPQHRTMKL